MQRLTLAQAAAGRRRCYPRPPSMTRKRHPHERRATSPATSAGARCCAASTPSVFLAGGERRHGLRAVHRARASTRAGSASGADELDAARSAPASAAALAARPPARARASARREPATTSRRARRRPSRAPRRATAARAARRGRASPRREPPREPRHVRAVPTNAELKMERALERLQRAPSTRARSPASPARSARPRSACARSPTRRQRRHDRRRWELSLVPLRGRPRRRGRRRAARSAQGDELSELEPDDADANAAADEHGRAAPSPPSMHRATDRSAPMIYCVVPEELARRALRQARRRTTRTTRT